MGGALEMFQEARIFVGDAPYWINCMAGVGQNKLSNEAPFI